VYLLIIKVFPLLTLCQAGGGGGFGGGGGGGGFGGGGGSGDGFGNLVYFLIRLVIEVPVVGVPASIGVVVFTVYSAKRTKEMQERRMIRRARRVLKHHERTVTWDEFEARDPGFARDIFLKRVKVAFHKAQDGWCAQDLEELAPFVSDGVFERFSVQIEEQRQEGWQQTMDSVRLGRLTFLHVEAGSPFDTITVRVPFEAQIGRKSLETQEPISGSLIKKEFFVECWTFVRRRGVKTLNGPGLMEGQCPNCGAPLSLNQSAQCGTCGCRARSGEFDWVLTEITQAAAWKPESSESVIGLNAFLLKDEGMSVQLLEDRASLAFWRKAAADRRAEVGPLVSVATARFCDEYEQGLQNPNRSFAADRAVGSVRTQGLLRGEHQDHALVEICWDGVFGRMRGSSRSGKRRRLRHNLFVFARKAGVQTPVVDSLTTAHCTECGAHDEGGTGATCPFCEAPRRGGDSTWLLDEVPTARAVRFWLDRLDEEYQQHENKAVGGPFTHSPQDLLAWATALAQVDHSISSTERLALTELARRAGLDEGELDTLLAQDDEFEQPVEVPKHERAETWLSELLQVAWADGTLSKAERVLLERMAKQLGMNRAQFRRALIAGRKARYQNSRRALSEQKRASNK